MRNFKILRIAPFGLSAILNGDAFKNGYNIATPIPKEMRIINCRFAFPDVVEIIIEHESFEEVKEHDEVPVFDIVYKKNHGQSIES